MMRIAFLCLFAIINMTSQAQDFSNQLVESYFVHLKNLRYTEAQRVSKQVEDSLLSKSMHSLASVLIFAGQEEIDFDMQIKSPDNLTNLVQKLALGYFYLYKNPYDEQPFKLFNEAYAISQTLAREEVSKFCVLSILEVYNFEISQSNEDATYFLDIFKSKLSDVADHFHYKMNLLLFNLRDIFLNIRLDMTFFHEFDEVMANFDSTHYFWPKYLSTKGVYLETLGEYEKAVELHQAAINRIGAEHFLKYIKFRSLIRLSEIYRNQHQYEKAIHYVEQAGLHGDKTDTIRVNYYINYYLSRNLRGLGKFEMAYDHLISANDYKDKSDYQRNTLAIADLKMRYQTQEKEIAFLKENKRARTAQNWLVAAISTLVFISVIYVLVQKNTKRKQLLAIKEKDIEKEKVATLLKEQELTIIDAMIEGQEKERQRIANDLHDDLGGHLTTIKLYFDSLKSSAAEDSKLLFEKTNQLISDAYEKVRSIAHAKNSGVIAEEGLLRSVKDMADKVSVANGLKIIVKDHGLNYRLENSFELNLFRMIQELVTNVIKHANATETCIHIINHGDVLNVMIEDNGIGFNSSGLTTRSDGMGIRSVDKRIEALGGSMDIDSEPGRGTIIILNIPI